MAKTDLTKAPVLTVKLAETKDERERAFRLRYRVFVEETNNIQLINEKGLEQDLFDEWCDHLIVTNPSSREVVGTYRLLPGERALQHQGFYSETEFDLSGFTPLKPYALEVGRSCIAPEYRNGRAIQMLWGGIADYIKQSGHKYLIGCVSLYLHDVQQINEIYSLLKCLGVVTDRFGVQPRESHRIQGLELLSEEKFNVKEAVRKLPPLLKGYQWLGAEIAGEPVYDPVFKTTDFFVVLETAKITKRYQRRFLA